MFLKGLMGYLPANLLQGLVGFLTLTIFTRILSPEDYGRYALALGVTNLTYTVCFCWIEAAMARFYPVEKKDNIEAPELYGTLYRLHAAVAALFVAICALGFFFWRTTTPGSHAAWRRSRGDRKAGFPRRRAWICCRLEVDSSWASPSQSLA